MRASVARMPVPLSTRHRPWAALLLVLGLGLGASPAAQAEGVLDRAARSGQLRLIGPADQPPMLSRDGRGQAEGYAVLIGERVAGLLTEALGRPVRLMVEPVADGALISERLGSGQADLACGLPFSWAREMTLDFTLPIGLSGLRLLAPAGRFSGAPAQLAGQAIAVVQGSLAESQLRGMQPAARITTVADLPAALTALSSGQVQGVIGDSSLLAGLARQRGLSGLALTPAVPYERYAVACAVPENDSAFRDLVNRAIVRLQQGYVDGDPQAVAAVNRWLGPGSALNLPADRIRSVFDALLMGVEALRPLPAAPR